MLGDVLKLDSIRASYIFVFLIAAVCPGVLTILFYKPDYIENLAVLTLVIVAISTSGPTLVMNVVLAYLYAGTLAIAVFLGSVMNLGIFFIALGVSGLFDCPTSGFISLVAIQEIANVFLSFCFRTKLSELLEVALPRENSQSPQ